MPIRYCIYYSIFLLVNDDIYIHIKLAATHVVYVCLRVTHPRINDYTMTADFILTQVSRVVTVNRNWNVAMMSCAAAEVCAG